MATEVGKAIAPADVELSEVYEQITTRIEIENALNGTVGSTARRTVVAIFDIMRLRREKRLPFYPASVIQAVVWLVVRDH